MDEKSECIFTKRKPIKDVSGHLFVDPGFNTAYCYWDLINSNKGNYIVSQCSVIGKDVEIKFKNLWLYFRQMLDKLEPEHIVFENVDFRSGSLKSVTSAKRGNLLNLDRLLGGYLCLTDYFNLKYSLYTAIQWKGNMNSSAVNSRIAYLTNKEFKSQHIADAFGLSLSVMGIFK